MSGSSSSSSSAPPEVPPPPPVPAMVNLNCPPPDQLSRVQEAIHHAYQQSRPINTQKAYRPKVKEWKQFCNHVYGHLPDNKRFLLNRENTYKFILFQAMRPKKAVGGGVKKKKLKTRRNNEFELEEEEEEQDDDIDIDDTSSEGIPQVVVSTRGEGFNPTRYDAVMSQFTDHNIFVEGREVRHPENPVGYQQVNTYKAALMSIHQLQVSCKLLDCPFEPNIWSLDHKYLMELIKGRKQQVADARYDEKMGGEATPYTQVDLIPQIESTLWNMGRGQSSRSQLAALRNRHSFAMTTSGILRFESLAERNLSEMFSFAWKSDRDMHDILITMYQLPSGKFVCFRFCLVLVLRLVHLTQCFVLLLLLSSHR